MAEAAAQQGINTVVCADAAAAAQAVDGILRVAPGGVDDWASRSVKDVVLIKASNAQRLWLVAEQLNHS